MSTTASRPVYDDRIFTGRQPRHDLVDKNRLMKRSHDTAFVEFVRILVLVDPGKPRVEAIRLLTSHPL